ncbi:MAG: CfaE/CblD family pilus tip adhesin [Stenotrophomonas maltophilia]
MIGFKVWKWLALPACWLTGTAQAQQPPETHPGSERRDVVLTYDRSALPGDQVLWAERTVLGYSQVQPPQYGTLHLTCSSDSDAARGQCPVSDTKETGRGHSDVRLRFKERRSGLTTELVVTGWLQRLAYSYSCGDLWQPTQRPLSTSHGLGCMLFDPAGTAVAMTLPERELEKLVAGRWDATLELFLRNDAEGPVLATYIFAFDLTITDHDNVAIYFPAFDQVSPLVGLNIDYNPISAPPSVGGSTVLDMCLYDGLGSQSEYFDVAIRDDGRAAPGRPDGMFSVWHHSGGREDAHRLDYQITLDHNGARLPMPNNRAQVLRGIDTARLRLVILPGMRQPVYCVPTPLSLVTPRVPASSKEQGYYEGQLTVEFTLPAAGP